MNLLVIRSFSHRKLPIVLYNIVIGKTHIAIRKAAAELMPL